jgi:zinc protease
VSGTASAIALLSLGQPPAQGPDKNGKEESAAIQAAAALYDDIRTETLPNGLRVCLKPVPDSPVVTTMVAYKVGSGDEDLDNTGLSHYLEHLMFKGTDRIRPGDIDRLTLRNGGENNAYTSEDYTVYHFDFASDRWEPALEVEADRMRNLRVDSRHEFEQEKGAVIEELQRNEDAPWDLEQKAILPLLFTPRGPYGHPVIGERQHVRGATAPVIKQYYDKWYYPNNAVLVICGGFDPDRAMARVKQLFGPIPSGKLPERKPDVAVERTHPVERQIPSKFEVPRMLMGFNTLRTGEPGYHALEVVQAILTGGKTGRLYKKLVEGEEVAGTVNSSNSSGRHPGWFAIQVELLKGKDRKQAEELVLAELRRLRDEPLGEVELKRAKQGILASVIFSRESVHNLGDSIARGVTTNDLDYLKNYLPLIASVTARDVQEIVRKYLDPDRRVVVWSVPGSVVSEPRDQQFPAGAGGAAPGVGGNGVWRSSRSLGSGGQGRSSLQDAHRVVLDNGLTLLLLENRRLPIVVAAAFVRNVRLLEPEPQEGVATLTGRLLDEGTARHTGPQIAELIENVGGALSLSSSGGSVQVLTPDRTLGLGLLLECLAQPTFPKQAFAREQQRLLSQIADAEQQPEVKAQMVYSKLIYGRHPYGRPAFGTGASVAKLKPEDCARWHRRLFVPENAVLTVVGDFDRAQLIDEVRRLCAELGWKKGPVPRPEPPPVVPPSQFTQKILTMPRTVQLHFYMGHPGIRRDNPDFYKLLVMDYVLGTGPGFTDRLSARLRDREGLAYTVSANITSSAAEQPGVFTCYIGTDPRNFARVKREFLEELARLRSEPPSAAEVEDAKKYLLGSLPFQLTTDERIANHLLAIERYHLGLSYFEDYRKAVAAVTVDDVRDMARKYLDPSNMVLVAAGPIDAQGAVLGRAPAAPAAGPR